MSPERHTLDDMADDDGLDLARGIVWAFWIGLAFWLVVVAGIVAVVAL